MPPEGGETGTAVGEDVGEDVGDNVGELVGFFRGFFQEIINKMNESQVVYMRERNEEAARETYRCFLRCPQRTLDRCRRSHHDGHGEAQSKEVGIRHCRI